MTTTARNQLILAARTDLEWLRRRHDRWEREVEAKAHSRSEWWLAYSNRDLAKARFRLEQYLEVDLRDPVEATAQQ